MIRARTLLPLLLAIILAPIFSGGHVQGDELTVVNFVADFFSSSYGFLDFLQSADRPYLGHHLTWFFERAAYYKLFHQIANIFGVPYIQEYLYACINSAYVLVAALLCYRFLRERQGYSKLFSALTVTSIFAGSYGIGFVTGGYLECSFILLIVLRMWLIERTVPVTYPIILALAGIDLFIISGKAYTALFLVPTAAFLTPFQPPRRWQQLSLYIGLIALGLIIIAKLKFSATSSLANWYVSSVTIYGPLEFLGHLVAELLSPAFGILWTMPLLLVAWNTGPHSRRALWVKSLGLVLMMLVFANFYWWQGLSGIPGNRYLFPFILTFLPEIAKGLHALIMKRPNSVILLPILIIIFLPALEYRNGLVGRYYEWRVPINGEASKRWNESIPSFDPLLHPGVFAWRVRIAKLTGEKLLQPSFSRDLMLYVPYISEMPGIARIGYILEQPIAAPEQVRLLQKLGLDSIVFWRAARELEYLFFFSWVCWATYEVGRKAKRSPLHES